MGERGNRFNRLLDRWAGIPLALCSTALRSWPRAPGHQPPRRVGFLCLGAIGDLLLLSALIAALRQRLPQARFVLLTSQANAATAKLIPGIDASAAFGVRQVPAMAAWLRRQRLDVLVDSSQWARLGAILANCSGAAVTIGFDSAGQYRAFGYTRKVEHRPDRHEVENFLALGRALYADLTGAPQLLLPTRRPEDLPAELQDGPHNRVYLHMWPSGTMASLKEWPAVHWARLARQLAAHGFQVCLTGAPGDAPRTEAFLRAHPQCPAISLAGKTSLSTLAWLFAHAAAVVSVNTGAMHLAALSGAPTVGLHGPTNPLRWGPVGPRVCSLLPHKGPYAYLHLGFEYSPPFTPCLDSLPVEDVLEGLRGLGLFGG